MVEKMSEIATDAPVICVGDLNSTPDTEQVKHIQTLLNDSYTVTVLPPYGPVGTFNGFKMTAPLADRIDYIFVSKSVRVLTYGALSDFKEQRYPSDHLPVKIKALVN